MWTYDQSTGWLYEQGKKYTQGYSGHGAGEDNPGDQGDKNVGPLPCGLYTISQAFDHPHCGPMSMRLTPAPSNEMFGRSGFLIHGDNAMHDHSASDGCIILPPVARAYINASPDRHLTVVASVDADNPPLREHIVV
jgi:hypothetical protein